jgi:O-antigen/teichoic acid export membrane protein
VNPGGGARRLALNTAGPLVARVVDAGFALVYLRLLGRPAVGDYTFLVVVTTYLDTLIDFGLNALVARDVARGAVSSAAAFRAVNVLRLGLWLAGLAIVALVYGPLRGVANLSDEAAVAGVVFYLALLPSVIAKTATAVLWAAERLEVTAAVQIVTTVLRTVIGTAALFAGYGFIGLAATSLVVNVITAGLLARLSAGARTRPPARAARDSPFPPSTIGYARWLRQSWPLFLNQLLQGLFFKIDAVLLLPLAGAVAAGAYAAAYRVAEGAGIIQSSFTLALFPRLSRAADDLTGAYRLALRVLLQLAFPLAAGTALLSEPIVALVGGREYLPDAAIALAILIVYLPLTYVNGLTQYVVIAVERQRILTFAFFAALVFNTAANFIFIPRFGYVAAAWVTVLSEIVLLVPFQWAARRAGVRVSLLREARIALLATLLMAPVVWWLRDAIHPIAAIVAGVVVYPLALWSLGGIDDQQIAIARQLFRRTPAPVASARPPRPEEC